MKSDSTKNTLIKSFRCAFEGLRFLSCERNFRIHILIAALVVIAGFSFQIGRIEWICLLLIIAIVLTLEAVNSGIERICDIISLKYDKRIKIVKDIAAGAVLIAAIIAVIIGCLIFLPYIYTCLL